MEAINHCPTSYPLIVRNYRERSIPYWDTLSKVVSIVCFPLRILPWAWNYATTSSQQYAKPEPRGPGGHAIVGSYPELRTRKFDILQYLVDVNDAYGKEHGICRFKMWNRNFYLVTDPELVKEIWQKPNAFVRGPSLSVWQDKFSPGGLAEGPETQKYRSQATKAIGEEALPIYFPGMLKITNEWLHRLHRYGDAPFNLMYETERAALATMGATLFNNDKSSSHKNPFGLSEENDELCTRFLTAFHTIFEQITDRMTSFLANIPLVGDKFYSGIYSDEEKKLIQAKNTLKKILEPIFRNILESKIDPTSHLFKLLGIFGIDLKNPNYNDLLNKSLGLLQAAFETSSKALGWILYHLARDQALQDKLREELQKTFGHKEPQSVDDLKNITLLSQIMEESLRLWAPFPILARDIQKPKDFTKFKVTKGGTFLISPYLIHREERNWDQPSTFNPNRFKKSDTNENNMLSDGWQIRNHQYAEFAGGIHRCPGRHFGKQELLINIAKLILRNKIVLANPEEKEPAGVKFCITLQPKRSIMVKLEALISLTSSDAKKYHHIEMDFAGLDLPLSRQNRSLFDISPYI
jgi:cytochrome P450